MPEDRACGTRWFRGVGAGSPAAFAAIAGPEPTARGVAPHAQGCGTLPPAAR